jgi:TetR/AcrR family transcriptional regulator, transcriptional repressor of bet genes
VPKLGMGPVRREQICRAAASVIAKDGLDRTTLREVAKVAGVSTGSVAHYFLNKEALLLETVAFVSERYEQFIRRALADVPSPDRLTAFISTVISMDSESLETWKVWLAAWSESTRSNEVRKVVQFRRHLYHDLIREVLADTTGDSPMEETELKRLVEEFDALLDGWALHILTGDEEADIEGATAHLSRFVLSRLDRV